MSIPKNNVCAGEAFSKKTQQISHVFAREAAPFAQKHQKTCHVYKTTNHTSHEHIRRGGYKNPTSLPLLLSFNPHPSRCFTKTLIGACYVCAGEAFPKSLKIAPCLPLRSHLFYKKVPGKYGMFKIIHAKQ